MVSQNNWVQPLEEIFSSIVLVHWWLRFTKQPLKHRVIRYKVTWCCVQCSQSHYEFVIYAFAIQTSWKGANTFANNWYTLSISSLECNFAFYVACTVCTHDVGTMFKNWRINDSVLMLIFFMLIVWKIKPQNSSGDRDITWRKLQWVRLLLHLFCMFNDAKVLFSRRVFPVRNSFKRSCIPQGISGLPTPLLSLLALHCTYTILVHPAV